MPTVGEVDMEVVGIMEEDGHHLQLVLLQVL
jgi:hypothetical protein